MNTTPELLKDYVQAGVYAATLAQQDQAKQSALIAGFDCWQMTLSATEPASTLLRQVGQSLHFPEWYGENWDALADCLTDLSWSHAEGFVLLLRESSALHMAQPVLWQTLIELLRDVSHFWRENQVAFWVLADDIDLDIAQLQDARQRIN
jgi:hypothetical protein